MTITEKIRALDRTIDFSTQTQWNNYWILCYYSKTLECFVALAQKERIETTWPPPHITQWFEFGNTKDEATTALKKEPCKLKRMINNDI